MDQQSALNRYGMMLMAASMAIALFVATQAIAGSASASPGEPPRQISAVR